MKILVASDLHGGETTCRMLLDRFREEKAEKLWLLGDILYHGPRNDLPDGYRPKGVISLLNPHKDIIEAVKGNCDSEVDQTVLDFDVSTTEKVFSVNGKRVLLTHGHHFSPDQPPEESFDIVFFGHTHIPFEKRIGETVFVNPGSVTLPKNGSPKSYLLFDENGITRKDLEGNPFSLR